MTDGDDMYTLGIDLGTTFSAAAVWRGGHAEISALGSRAAAIPSVVLMREDATVLTGDAANRRATSEPHRVAREFKRRIGDTTPVLLGGAPYSAEALTARLLRAVVEQVTTAEGGNPRAMVLSHPANWGPYKIDLLAQAVRIADVQVPVSYVTEPEAAAVFYATQQRILPGSVVAVYDLGGGTFDAAVLRRTADGFEVLGQPEGIERLGGIDVDAAVFDHVARALGGKLEELDEDDPAAATAVARLRSECVDAKEALSSDTDVSVPVILPNVTTDVRLTRSELEAMVRPALQDTIDALRRALRSAEVAPEDLDSVLLVGGASRMPLVAQLVGAEIGRPVAVDAHPKHAVALGAAWLAAVSVGATAPAGEPAPEGAPGAAPEAGAATIPAPRAPSVGAAGVPMAAGAVGIAAGAAGVAAGGAGAAAGAAGGPAVLAPTPPHGVGPQPTGGPPTGGFAPLGAAAVPPPRAAENPTALLAPGGGPPPSRGPAFPGATPPGRSHPDFSTTPAAERGRSRKRLMLLTAAAVVAVCAAAVAVPEMLGSAKPTNASTPLPASVAPAAVVPTTTTTVTETPTTTPEPEPEQGGGGSPRRQTGHTRITHAVPPPPPPPVVHTSTVTSVTTVTHSETPTTTTTHWTPPPSASTDPGSSDTPGTP